jgi:aryl-alcohol dehydrogenase-like predicted oxidoreductase
MHYLKKGSVYTYPTALHRALDLGVNFFDTADVYRDGQSERLLTKLKQECKEKFYIVTKTGSIWDFR